MKEEDMSSVINNKFPNNNIISYKSFDAPAEVELAHTQHPARSSVLHTINCSPTHIYNLQCT